MKAIPNPGTYSAGTAGQMVVYETKQGALCVAVPVKTLASEVAWQGKHTITLVKQDGTVQTRSLETLRKVFGWDGINPFDLEDMDTSAIEFEIVGEHKVLAATETEPEREIFSVQYLNPTGGSTNMPEKVTDRKSLLTKYGSKFKALSGAKKPAAATVAKKAAAPEPEAEAEESEPELPATKPAAKPAVKGPPGRKSIAAVARISTQEEVWAALVAANDGDEGEETAQKYYGACDAVIDGSSSDPTLLDTPAKWGQVADKLGV